MKYDSKIIILEGSGIGTRTRTSSLCPEMLRYAVSDVLTSYSS